MIFAHFVLAVLVCCLLLAKREWSAQDPKEGYKTKTSSTSLANLP